MSVRELRGWRFSARAATALPATLLVALSLSTPAPAFPPANTITPRVPLQDVSRIAAGRAFGCALTTTGTVRCWGTDADGQLGIGTATVPALVPRSLAARPVIGLGEARVLAVGLRHACAVDRKQGAKCWGSNTFGQLGNADQTSSPTHTPVNVLGLDVEVRGLAAGYDHSCALTAAGAVLCWGDNAKGQLGDGSTAPQNTARGVTALGSTVQAVTAGKYHTCALTLAGGVKCWGRNDSGQLGNGNMSTLPVTTPVDVVGLSAGVLGIGAGGDHTCAITASRAVMCWGSNTSGQLGTGNLTPSSTPVAVQLGSGLVARALFLTDAHSCAQVYPSAGGASGVRCWGNNGLDQLISNNGANLLFPADVTVAGASDLVDAIAGTELFTCARIGSTGVKCRGDNDMGQLGRGIVEAVNPRPAADNIPADVLVALGTSVAGANATARAESAARTECVNNAGDLGNAYCDLYAHPGLTSATFRVHGNTLATGSGNNNGAVRLEMWLDTPWDNNCNTSCNANACITSGVDNATRLEDPNETGSFSCEVVVAGGATRRIFLRQVNSLATASETKVVARVIAAPVKPSLSAAIRRQTVATGGDFTPQPSADGRYYVYRSGNDIRRFDVDNPNASLLIASGGASEPSVSANGQRVVLVQADPPAAAQAGQKATTYGIWLRNVITGTSQRLGNAIPPGGSVSSKPRISGKGNAVVWTAVNTDPAMGQVGKREVFSLALPDDNGVAKALVTGPQQCVSCKARTAAGAAAGNSDGDSFNAVISADGSKVAFETEAKNQIVGAPAPCAAPGTSEIQLRNLISGTNQRISPPPTLPPANCGSEGSTAPSIDYAGDTIAFTSDQPLVPNALGGVPNVFVSDQGSLAAVSQTAAGTAANAPSTQAAISGDGRSVAFDSEATNLDPTLDDPTLPHMRRPHVRRLGGTTQRFSRGQSLLEEANGPSNSPALDYNGDGLFFDSTATNYVASDTNGVSDVFTRDVYTASILGSGFE